MSYDKRGRLSPLQIRVATGLLACCPVVAGISDSGYIIMFLFEKQQAPNISILAGQVLFGRTRSGKSSLDGKRFALNHSCNLTQLALDQALRYHQSFLYTRSNL